ncbi:hypothetical protein VTK73DRAFT_6169 [Phialemonium thermophilum]|uniref:C3H1-type domain-containing protein n=1 Tax=Phialemonium thermophilum TaxID=223376 RepID=A0ABR3UZY2_9PEZI
MTPYDMLRSILGPSRTDEEIDAALAMHGYDLGATVAAIMDTQVQDNLAAAAKVEETRTLLLGKALGPADRPVTPASAADQQPKSGVVCKFFLSTGQCLRADCRFSHDLSNHVCKYWVAGNCLAGSTCIFSHDPAHLVQGLQLDGSSTPPAGQKNSSNPPPTQDHHNFPALKPGTPDPWPTFTPSAREAAAAA